MSEETIREVIETSIFIEGVEKTIEIVSKIEDDYAQKAISTICTCLLARGRVIEVKEFLKTKLKKVEYFPPKILRTFLLIGEVDTAIEIVNRMPEGKKANNLRTISDFLLATGNLRRAHQVAEAAPKGIAQDQALETFWI